LGGVLDDGCLLAKPVAAMLNPRPAGFGHSQRGCAPPQFEHDTGMIDMMMRYNSHPQAAHQRYN
jgi:hypothetical protein